MDQMTYPRHVLEYRSLEEIATQARPYPVAELVGCETGLVLFAAAYLGHNDAIHFAEAGIPTVCVDRDGERLQEMQRLYPATWAFVEHDAWTYAEAAAELETVFDVVSLDPFSGDAMARVLDNLSLFAAIANRVLIVGMAAGYTYRGGSLPGWEIAGRDVERAPGVWWHVLRRRR